MKKANIKSATRKQVMEGCLSTIAIYKSDLSRIKKFSVQLNKRKEGFFRARDVVKKALDSLDKTV